ncbi:sulfotransferase family protein [Trinickia acidisoli]|uniref:sulfotransferase family protein n=1 Tax=Trinickia acidisoli TaxID=2767482 RepID=UPI002413EB5B|nr:sulfotransferase [Trinickia acidisoli]
MNGFIIGTGRCGTTMLASILDAHPEACVPPETQLLFEYMGNGPALHEIFAIGVQYRATLAKYLDFVQKRCPCDLRKYFDHERYFARMTYPVATLRELMGDFYTEIAKAKGKRICLEQTPWYGLGIDVLRELYPDARYIHMIRDGRDVAISFARTPWWHKDIGKNLARWAFEASLIKTLCEEMLAPEQVLTVHYEKFVEDPESELRRICRFLRISYDPRVLEPGAATDYRQFAKGHAADVASPAFKSWSTTKANPVFKDSAGAWQRCADYDFSRMPLEAKQCLIDFGYAV